MAFLPLAQCFFWVSRWPCVFLMRASSSFQVLLRMVWASVSGVGGGHVNMSCHDLSCSWTWFHAWCFMCSWHVFSSWFMFKSMHGMLLHHGGSCSWHVVSPWWFMSCPKGGDDHASSWQGFVHDMFVPRMVVSSHDMSLIIPNGFFGHVVSIDHAWWFMFMSVMVHALLGEGSCVLLSHPAMAGFRL